jgi:MoxR-like ATPase
VFNQFVLADEINRASPKTQSALFEAMEERQVTVDRDTHPLDPPFMVIATQNPLDHEGTYPLPESQLDRFLMRISIGYPDRDDAVGILEDQAASSGLPISPVATSLEVRAMAELVRGVHVAPSLRDYIVSLAEASRSHHAIALGASPRATLYLQRVAQALAASHDRSYVVPDDIKAIARPVLGHRLVLTPEAQLQGLDVERVIGELLDAVPVPTAASL